MSDLAEPLEPHLGDALSGLLDGELALPAELVARQHLAVCGRCTAEYEGVGAARAWVRGLPAAEPPFGFYERLLAAGGPIAIPRRSVLASPWARLGIGAASVAAAVTLIGFVSPHQAPVSPPVNQLVEAHATGASVNGDPLSQLAPIGVPISFRR